MYTKEWINEKDVYIPPRNSVGFQEKVIKRKKITPKTQGSSFAHEYDDNDDATVMLQPQTIPCGVIKRIATGEIVVVKYLPFQIGKSQEADYVIKDNPTISRFHAEIGKNNAGYYIKDLASKNHVFVDEVMIEDEIPLQNGTRFKLAQEEFEFTIMAG